MIAMIIFISSYLILGERWGIVVCLEKKFDKGKINFKFRLRLFLSYSFV